VVTFAVALPAKATEDEVQQWLSASGFTRVQARREAAGGAVLDVVADRFRIASVERARAVEAIEVALRRGGGEMAVYVLAEEGEPDIWCFSSALHCPESGRSYQPPIPALFSFNSPVGACPVCRGFGRVIGVDWGLVVPDERLTLRQGALKPIQTPAWRECQRDLLRYAGDAGVDVNVPWMLLPEEQRRWVLDGDAAFTERDWNRRWYGMRRFFQFLESRAYKMHIRVLLSRYRSYTECPECHGARLRGEALLWRVGSKADADAVLPPARRFMPPGAAWGQAQLESLPGLNLHDVMRLPISRLRDWVQRQQAALPGDSSGDSGAAAAQRLVLTEIAARLAYLVEAGLGYLTLDRQSRTLSGGEVQRINLTTALGSSLTSTLFVLDEPSTGLHPRDVARVTGAMQRLRDAGNTLVVVEHDAAVIRAADRVLDFGPGPGEAGGRIVFDGSPAQLEGAATLTGDYISGRRRVASAPPLPVDEKTLRLTLRGVSAHNLKNVDVAFPLQRLVAVAGVSGSGKSTLIGDVLAPALQRHFGEGGAAAGAHDALEGAQQLAGVVLVDQSAIGRTARSNPASYVGAWDAIRRLFAAAPLARQRGWTAGKFSFNSGDGRCPVCGGTGFEHVEMQFLSDVYLRCPECDGRRWRDEVLEVTIERAGRRLNVADVLALTADEAARLFAQDWEVLHAVQPLLDVGLGYLRLGQSVPTLSGGEAQRLKLAGHLADAARRTSAKGKKKAAAQGGLLFLLDEPSCGLHPHDIAHLMGALRRLLEAGHSVIVIEHNLDVMAACDWLIELGPDGGDAGGQLVAQGAPRAVATMTTHTGAALRDYFAALDAPAPGVREARAVYKSERITGRKSRREAAFMEKNMEVERAREHNLRALSVVIPHGGLNVVTGVSGSGKSTLAFDIIFGEGQRRYLESLGAYARAVVQPPARPDVDAVRGIAPTVAIEQRTTRGGRKSTVGTATEIWHFLRLLFVKLGVQHCIHDGAPVQPQTPAQMAARISERYAGQRITLLAPLVVARKGIYTELAEWAKARGFEHLRVDGAMLPTDGFPKIARYKEHTIELPVASLKVGKRSEAALRQAIEAALEHGHGALHVLPQVQEGQEEAPRVEVFSSHRACPVCATGYAELDPRLFSYNSRHGWCPECVGTGLKLTRAQRRALDDSVAGRDEGGRERSFTEADAGELDDAPCPACGGTRLNAAARAVRLHEVPPLPGQTAEGVAIHELARLPVQDLLAWFEGLRLDGRAAAVARELLPEITGRLRFLQRVGLGYLTLERGAPTLSGGEAQRIRLAAQLGSTLQGVCYVLDEPTIGLHARDRGVLLDALHGLAQRGNTLLVVEHDMETIRSASHLIDIGPGAGVQGGRLVAQGSAADIAAAPESATGRYLLHAMQHPQHARRAVGDAPPAVSVSDGSGWLHVQGATLHNLQDVDVAIPLQRLVAVTGVSGSGKSTFAREVLLAGLQRLLGGSSKKKLSGCRAISGFAQIERVLEVDQTPIGKTPRSCPATYIGFWSEVRQLFAQTQHAQERGWDAGRFSFNTGAGRCPVCEGQGMRTVEMAFLPDVKVPCEACGGQRFGSDTLAATWRGRNIGEVLQMQVDEALEFFAARPSIAHALQLLHDVGLGYLTLGQPSPTLSGGEAQRIKLVSELVKVRDDVGKRGRRVPPTLYVLDEPTVGLHMQDAEKLIAVLHRLVDAGHSVVVIEHDLDLIAEADWVIDLGPEGGAGGGRLAACGTPEAVARSGTHTGRALAAVLAPA
ncbi:MAG: ATP-binding cassette domain-containing protein, partial [Ottowia sp.]|nr:ATP-binding cassette domain-containing protein [Ottowia sp.]